MWFEVVDVLGSARSQVEMGALVAYADLRRTRSRHRHVDVIDVAAGAVGLLIIGTLAVSAAVTGAAILLLVVAALGSGSRGGSLAFEAPLVFLVLMAPLDRGLVLRQPAVRQVLVGVAALS